VGEDAMKNNLGDEDAECFFELSKQQVIKRLKKMGGVGRKAPYKDKILQTGAHNVAVVVAGELVSKNVAVITRMQELPPLHKLHHYLFV
jgi:hypothetical protein